MSWRIFVHTLLVAVALALPGRCFADGQPALLKSALTMPEKIWVGQRLDLTITLYTTTSFTGVPRFDFPQDAELAILGEDSRPLLDSETIDGTSYISKAYSLSLFPLRTGTLTLPAFQVAFGYQGADGQEADVTLPTTAERITVLTVPGADPDLPVITASDLKVDDRFDPAPDKAAVGDAFTRTIVVTATGTPGMALPPLVMRPIEGLGLYANPPQVGTDTQRGDFIGKRVETYSLVCEKAGTYLLPEMRIQWWNPTDETLHEVKLASRTLRVAANPVLDSGPTAGDAGSGAVSPWLWAGVAALLAGAAAGLVVLRHRRNTWLHPGQEHIEKALFTQFERAAASDDPARTMRTLARWLEASGLTGVSSGVSGFVERVGDPELTHQVAALEASLYGRGPQPWSGKTLSEKIAAGRAKLRRLKVHPAPLDALGPLNP